MQLIGLPPVEAELHSASPTVVAGQVDQPVIATHPQRAGT